MVGPGRVVVAGAAGRAARVERRRRRRQRVRRLHPERHLCRSRPTTSRSTSRATTTRTTSSRTSPSATDGEPVTLGYYGAPGVPGFGVSAIYTDQQFSLVITDPDTDDAVACGDILRPDADQFGEAGVAVVQLLPGRSSSASKGSRPSSGPRSSASWTSRRPGCGSSSPPTPVSAPAEAAAGYDGYVQGGHVRFAGRATLRVELKSRGRPRRRRRSRPSPAETGDPVTVAYYGSRRRTRLRAGRGLHRPGLLAGHHRHRVGRAGRVRRHPRTGRRRVRGGRTGARAAPAGR